MNQTPELNLLRKIQNGDEEALVTLHSRYSNLVYSVAFRVLNDQMAAEEVTQDTFMRIWRKSGSFDPDKGRFVTWLLTVTRRLAIDRLRLWQRREPMRATLFMDENPQLWEQVLAVDGYSDLRGSLVSAIRDLPDAQREAIELAYFYGMSHSDIAEYLHAPLGTVKTRIRQGMQKLRSAWTAEPPANLKVED
jgi:RNA polymerase sigma-70 factor (ECF subfamily)